MKSSNLLNARNAELTRSNSEFIFKVIKSDFWGWGVSVAPKDLIYQYPTQT